MRRSITIALMAKRLVLLQKGNLCRCTRAFSAAAASSNYDYREKIRFVQSIKLDDALDLFSEMVQSRPLPSMVDFSKLLSAIAKMKKFDVVISLGEQMQTLGIPHNLYTYSIFINCFCCSDQLSLALAVLAKMIKLGYEPSIVTLTSLLNGYCYSDRISDAVALLDQMVEMGYKPNTVTFTTLIHGLFQKANLEKPKSYQSDASVMIVDNATGPSPMRDRTGFVSQARRWARVDKQKRLKLAVLNEGDEQQLNRFCEACKGLPQEVTPSVSPSRAVAKVVDSPIKEDGDSRLCAICVDASYEAVCVPCGHVAGCVSCLRKIKDKKFGCPICRANIDLVIKLYHV